MLAMPSVLWQRRERASPNRRSRPRERRNQVRPIVRQRAQVRKLLRQFRCNDLEDLLWLVRVTQGVLAERGQRHARGNIVCDQTPDGLGDEDLAAMTCAQQTRQSIQCRGKVVAALVRLGLP